MTTTADPLSVGFITMSLLRCKECYALCSFGEIVVSWFGRLLGDNVRFDSSYKRFEVMTLPRRLPVTWSTLTV